MSSVLRVIQSVDTVFLQLFILTYTTDPFVHLSSSWSSLDRQGHEPAGDGPSDRQDRLPTRRNRGGEDQSECLLGRVYEVEV